jgi:hypothetical protein
MSDLRGTTRRRCGGFAKQVPGNVENGETPTPLGERLEVRLDENLDGLFAGVDLDSNGVVAKVDLVASSVLSSNDGIRHCGLAFGIGSNIMPPLTGPDPFAAIRTGIPHLVTS